MANFNHHEEREFGASTKSLMNNKKWFSEGLTPKVSRAGAEGGGHRHWP